MIIDRFLDIVNARIKACLTVLAKKGEEYSAGGDRLSNFKRAALLQLVEPETALIGMLSKHVVSVYDIVDQIEFDGVIPSKEMLSEKITDWINYTILLEALIEERRENEEKI